MAIGRRRTEARVVGCGVSGLSCGIRLLEKQFPVTLFARDLPPNTTSDVAAAVWYLYEVGSPERALKWGRVAIEEFYRLAKFPETGVHPVQFVQLFKKPEKDPWWKNVVHEFSHVCADDLPSGYQDGYRVEVPLIETPKYMHYLMGRFKQLGGQIEQRTINALSDLYRENTLIINCTGVWAHKLVGDDDVHALRGQIIRVKASGIDHCIVDEEDPRTLTYVFPRNQDCILGGTAERDNWSLEVDYRTSDEIIQRCKQLVPTLKITEVLQHLVGLRPSRGAIRLEIEKVSEQCGLIHNYGHGGSGFTLSWGCAEEVAHLAEGFRDELLV